MVKLHDTIYMVKWLRWDEYRIPNDVINIYKNLTEEKVVFKDIKYDNSFPSKFNYSYMDITIIEKLKIDPKNDFLNPNVFENILGVAVINQ